MMYASEGRLLVQPLAMIMQSQTKRYEADLRDKPELRERYQRLLEDLAERDRRFNSALEANEAARDSTSRQCQESDSKIEELQKP